MPNIAPSIRRREQNTVSVRHYPIEAAHPLVAGFLADVAHNFANAAELEFEQLTDWRVELAAAVLFGIGCMVFSFVAPYLPALGRLVAP